MKIQYWCEQIAKNFKIFNKTCKQKKSKIGTIGYNWLNWANNWPTKEITS